MSGEGRVKEDGREKGRVRGVRRACAAGARRRGAARQGKKNSWRWQLGGEGGGGAGWADAPPPPGCAQVVRAEATDIWYDNASRAKLQAGINKVADAVGVTLGPRGASPCAPRPQLPQPPARCVMAFLSAQRWQERAAVTAESQGCAVRVPEKAALRSLVTARGVPGYGSSET